MLSPSLAKITLIKKKILSWNWEILRNYLFYFSLSLFFFYLTFSLRASVQITSILQVSRMQYTFHYITEIWYFLIYSQKSENLKCIIIIRVITLYVFLRLNAFVLEKNEKKLPVCEKHCCWALCPCKISESSSQQATPCGQRWEKQPWSRENLPSKSEASVCSQLYLPPRPSTQYSVKW